MRPFDVSILFDHMLDKYAWRTNLKMIEIDITIVPPATTFNSAPSQAACSKELLFCLREGKKKMFCHKGKTDKESGISYNGDEIMSLIGRNNMILIPASITPHGHTGPLLNRFLYDHNTTPHNMYKNRPNDQRCEESARSTKAPHDILGRANQIWRNTNPQHSFSGSYKAMDPRTHLDQCFGLVMSALRTSHLLRAHTKVNTLKSVSNIKMT